MRCIVEHFSVLTNCYISRRPTLKFHCCSMRVCVVWCGSTANINWITQPFKFRIFTFLHNNICMHICPGCTPRPAERQRESGADARLASSGAADRTRARCRQARPVAAAPLPNALWRAPGSQARARAQTRRGRLRAFPLPRYGRRRHLPAASWWVAGTAADSQGQSPGTRPGGGPAATAGHFEWFHDFALCFDRTGLALSMISRGANVCVAGSRAAAGSGESAA